jgi:hypothetical protein
MLVFDELKHEILGEAVEDLLPAAFRAATVRER